MVIGHAVKIIGTLVISFLVGFLFYYTTSTLATDKKKVQLEEVSSQIVNFVIFIWLGKIITNLQVFVKAPLTILAYPSDAAAFYVAVVLTMLTVGYKVVKHKFDVGNFSKTLLPIFLAASFVYEFIGIIIDNNTLGWAYLILLAILLLSYMRIYEQISISQQIYLMIGWSVGHLLINWYLPFTIVFGYMISPLFFVILIILLLSILIYNRRKVEL